MLWVRTWLARRLVIMAARLNPMTVILMGHSLSLPTPEQREQVAEFWAAEAQLRAMPGEQEQAAGGEVTHLWINGIPMPTSEPPQRGQERCSCHKDAHPMHLDLWGRHHHQPCPLAAPRPVARGE